MEKLAQCEAALASQQVGFSALWLACNVCVCGLAQEEQSIFGVCLLIYINRLFSFPWRYIYVADVMDHTVHVLEKHANWSLTHVKVRCCCSIKRRQMWILDRIVLMNAWDFSMKSSVNFWSGWLLLWVGRGACTPRYRASGLPPSHQQPGGILGYAVEL